MIFQNKLAQNNKSSTRLSSSFILLSIFVLKSLLSFSADSLDCLTLFDALVTSLLSYFSMSLNPFSIASISLTVAKSRPLTSSL